MSELARLAKWHSGLKPPPVLGSRWLGQAMKAEVTALGLETAVGLKRSDLVLVQSVAKYLLLTLWCSDVLQAEERSPRLR